MIQAWLIYGFYAGLNIPEFAAHCLTENLRFTLRAKKFLRSFAGNNLAHKYSMRNIYTILTLAPAPLFFAGLVYSLYAPSPICGSDYSMTVMWAVMALAHLTPWLLWLQQRNFTRN